MGRKIYFTIKNVGALSTRYTYSSFTYNLHGQPRGKRIPVPGLSAGGAKTVSRVLDASIEGNLVFTATLNPDRYPRELRYDNNRIQGTLLPADQSAQYWKNRFGVEDHTLHSINVAVPPGQQNPMAHPYFRFVINNRDARAMTSPVEAVLVVREDLRVVGARSWDVPTLSPGASGQNAFRIDWPGTFPVGTNVDYTLALRLGNATLQVALGVVQIGYHRASGQ